MEFQEVTGMIIWTWMRWGQKTEQKIQYSNDKKGDISAERAFWGLGIPCGITNQIMLLYFQNVNKYEILFLSLKSSVNTKKGQI